jgi:RNA polymerase sigma-70 factor (ECF subfamily)
MVLLARSRPRLYEYIAHRLPADLARFVDPDDIVQQTHVAAFRRLGMPQSIRPESFHRWLLAIALNKLRNAIKRHRTAKRGGGRARLLPHKRSVEDSTIELLDKLAGPGRTPSRSAARREAVKAVQEAISDLPVHYRKAVQLVYIEGYTLGEAAAEMRRTNRAVQGLCRRGLRRLKQRLVSGSRLLSSIG